MQCGCGFREVCVIQKGLLFSLIGLFSLCAQAMSPWEGAWTEDGQKYVQINEFYGQLTLHTQAFFSNGAVEDYFFEFDLPKNRPVQDGEILPGRLRSVDGLYSCVFDQPAQMQMDDSGHLRLHYPLLTFFRRTTEVREDGGSYYQRRLSWDGWEWIESITSFPLEKWRTISSECVISQTHWQTSVLSR